MSYRLRREVEDGSVVRISLGVPEVDAYLKFLKQGCRFNTWISYGYDLQVFLNYIEKPITEITPADILGFIESQRGAPNRQGRAEGLSTKGPGLSNRTIKRRLAAVYGFYEYLRIFRDLPSKNNPVPRGLVKRNSFWGVRYGDMPSTPLVRAPETLPRPLNPEELSPFIDSLRFHRDKAMVLLMLLAGLRKSEVLKLSLKDIDFGQRTLMVREGKGGYQRVVAISEVGLKELLCYLEGERPHSNSDRVFLVLKGPHRGQPLTVAALDTIMEYHRQKAETPGIQCHRLRHTCFTKLRQGGMSLEALQARQDIEVSLPPGSIYTCVPANSSKNTSRYPATCFHLPLPKGGRMMVSQLVRNTAQIELKTEGVVDSAQDREQDIAAYHACLIAEYMSYLKSAGYSTLLQAVRKFERGARCFLMRFPDPQEWLRLSTREQCLCDRNERSFIHYLFLRRLLPMPLGYVLMPRPRLYQMAVRLMERETHRYYQQAALRLGYRDSGIESQFRSLLCLMIWAQKPMDALTIGDLEDFIRGLRKAYFESVGNPLRHTIKNGLPARWDAQLKSVRKMLYHMGVFPRLDRGTRRISFEKQWEKVPPDMALTARRYLQQLALSLRPESAYQEKTRLFRFFSWLASSNPEIIRLDQIQRCHIEAFKEYLRWVPPQHKSNRLPGDVLCASSRYHILAALFYFFSRIGEWQWPEAPKRVLMFIQDLPPMDHPSPRFLDEVTAAKFLQAARSHPDLFTKLCSTTLLLTGLRQSEFLNLPADCVVQIGDSHWLHVPVGKTYHDRFVPLNPEVKALLDEWLKQNAPKKPYDFLFAEYGHRYGRGKVTLAVERVRKAAGIKERITPHRLRHTLATLAVNRGMPLESIAALLGHRSLSMTMVYARIANRTVQQEYSQVSQYLEEVCHKTELITGTDSLNRPVPVEGAQMRKLRQDHWRMLGNGYCTRPEGVPCEYETICESCPCFSTTVEFLPILNKQRRDAEHKVQTQRADVFARLIRSMKQAPVKAITTPS